MTFAMYPDTDGYWVINEDTGQRLALFARSDSAICLVQALEHEVQNVFYAQSAKDPAALGQS